MSTAKTIERSKQAQGGEYNCVYCRGKGVDPFAVMSPLSLCAVCLGKGTFAFPASAHPCAYCQGTGESPTGTRCACLACRGKGLVSVHKANSACPDCSGTGAYKPGLWYCFRCHGSGVISEHASGAGTSSG